MPKFGTHMLIAELAAKRNADLYESLQNAGNAFRLGSVGPDLTLFLFDPILSDANVRKGFDGAMDALNKVREIKDALDRITAGIDKPVGDWQNWITGGLYPDIKAVIQGGIDATLLALKLGLATGASPLNISNPLADLYAKGEFNQNLLDPKYLSKNFAVNAADNAGFPFRHFGHPFTDDAPWAGSTTDNLKSYNKWWWMDMLHYRKSGTFAKNMLQAASNQITTAYARGYLSHVAGDICGHPFINSLVGGPFRNHAYRHIVLEGLADTWLWDRVGKGDIANSSLHDLLSVPEEDFHSIAELIIQTMRDTYKHPMVPDRIKGNDGYPDIANLKSAYDFMNEYLRLSTAKGIVRPVPPPDDPGELIRELTDLLSRNTPSSAPSFNPNKPVDYVTELLAWFFKGIVFIAMIATLPVATLIRILNAASRWVLYFIKMSIYFICSAIRMLLAFMGYGYASSDDFANFGFVRELILSESYDGYPYKSTPTPKTSYYWLFPPRILSTGLEKDYSSVGPIPGRSTPYWMIDKNNRMDPRLGNLIMLMNASSPEETRQLYSTVKGTGFGNAVDFYLALFEGALPIPDLDLDGDRGYGFRSWTNLPPDETYI